MNFKHIKNLQDSIDGMKKIFSISWSPNLMRLAIAHVDEKRSVRVTLFDESGEKKDTFPTRPANKTNKSYVVRDIAFAPDSLKLAVSQSDNIVFIYNLGTNWADKKTICNKFEQTTQVTTLIWPVSKPNELYFAVAEGKVKAGFLRSNAAQTLYSTESYIVSLCCSPDGKYLLSGHLDQSVYKFSLEQSSIQKIIQFSSIPYSLAWGIDILVAGSDERVYIFNESGIRLQTFDYNGLKDFTLARVNTTGDSIAVGNYNRFLIYTYNSKKLQWEETCHKVIENYYSVTALCWKPDVSCLVTGSLCGSIDIFESCLKRSLYNDKFEITYMSSSQLNIKNIENNKRLVVKIQLSTEIAKMNIFNNNIVFTTKDSLIIGDVDGGKYSEIPWTVSGKEIYDFSNPGMCMIYHTGELVIIEYGKNEIIGCVKADYIHPNVVSARVDIKDNIILAYLLDPSTLNLQNLTTGEIVLNYSHKLNIEFLDLGKTGDKLIFRDIKKTLYLYNITEGKKYILLNFCSFVQWIPDTQVLVAQENKNLCIWYHIEDISNIKTIGIKGNIEEIRRKDNKTEVLVEEGSETQIYLLDNNLINLNEAIEIGDLAKAVGILEYIGKANENEVYWKIISKKALDGRNLPIAQHCFAALGNYPKSNYIKKLIKEANEKGIEHPVIQAKLLILNRQLAEAEVVMEKNNLTKVEIYGVDPGNNANDF
jgi:intraflagellar transport protein 172